MKHYDTTTGKAMHTIYEWDIETWTLDESGDPEDCEDHNHFDSFEKIRPGILAEVDGEAEQLVLVRDNFNKPYSPRGWAYAAREKTSGRWILPEHFEDAYGGNLGKVPQRFHRELAKAQE